MMDSSKVHNLQSSHMNNNKIIIKNLQKYNRKNNLYAKNRDSSGAWSTTFFLGNNLVTRLRHNDLDQEKKLIKNKV